MLQLVDNWATIAKKAWSMYGLYALFILGVLNDYVIPLAAGKGFIGAGFGTVVTVVAGLTAIARIVDQFLPRKR